MLPSILLSEFLFGRLVNGFFFIKLLSSNRYVALKIKREDQKMKRRRRNLNFFVILSVLNPFPALGHLGRIGM